MLCQKQRNFCSWIKKAYLCRQRQTHTNMISFLWIVITMFLGLSNTSTSVWQETVATNEIEEESVVKSCDEDHGILFDGEQLPYNILSTAPVAQRLSSSRPTRPHSLGGGKSGRFANYWEATDSCCFLYFLCLFFLCACRFVQRRIASPRFYYVITLRRILC